ncbi:hypothetical protein [Nostoc sp.]|uniref:hypothetical protein n=1 Tax=Nostoc sp. TaxID=1180 RepID=UPI002FF47C2A
MGSHCGGRVPRHKASGVETPYSPSGILRQALASPFGRRPRWLPNALAPFDFPERKSVP